MSWLTEPPPSFPVITVPYNAGDFTGLAGMTWTVAAADLAVFKYALFGKVMMITVQINTSTVGGVLSPYLLIKIPGGYVADSHSECVCYLQQGVTPNIGLAATDPGDAHIYAHLVPAVNLAPSVDTTYVFLTMWTVIL